jgi:hypothetical protein
MLAYRSPRRAIKDYLKSHYDAFGPHRLSAMVEVSYDELKDWLKNGDMHKPISEQGYGHVVARRGVGGGVTKADTVSQSSGLTWYDQTTPRRKKKRKKGRKLRSGARWLTL